MSIFDSTHSAVGDSDATTKAKLVLTEIMMTKFKERGFKAHIKTEVPALFQKPYHSDLGVLIRKFASEDPTVYHFFNIEIDGNINHKTKIKDLRDDEKTQAFLKHSGTITIRFDVGEIVGKDKKTPNEIFNKIWEDVLRSYLIVKVDSYEEKQAIRNKEFAISLKENTLPRCRHCKHPAQIHTLTACHYTQTNQKHLRCDCMNPMFISDE